MVRVVEMEASTLEYLGRLKSGVVGTVQVW